MPESSGRSAIRSAAERTFAEFGDAKLSTGRIWIKDAHSALVELLFSRTNTGDAPELGVPKATNMPVGVLFAAMFDVDDHGRIRRERRYFDMPTIRGQLAPDPKNPVRPVMTRPPNGTGVFTAGGAPGEAKTIGAQGAYVAALNTRNLDETMKLIAPEFVSDDYVSSDALRGAPALRGLLGELMKAVPDLRAAIASSFAAGDDGVFEMEFTGTPNGGKRVDVHEIQVNQFKDGRMTRSWSWSNAAEN